MKNIFSIISIILVLSCEIEHATNGLIADEHTITSEQLEFIFETTKIFPNNTQVSFAIIENGQARYYGIKRVNDTIFPTDNQDKVFEIGSISKVFTSTLLANAVIEGKVELNDPITEYLDFTLKGNAIITLKQLANHTSGLPGVPTNTGISFNPNTKFRFYDEVKLRDYMTKDLRLTYQPGEGSRYSNLGAGLLGYVLTQIENKDYESLIQRNIFKKYQMTRSTTNRFKIDDFLVTGRSANGSEVANLEIGVLVGAGGIFSTTRDLSNFVIAQFNDSNRELELTREKTFEINNLNDRGLSWRIIREDSLQTLHYHNGATGGYRSFLVMDIKRKNGVVFLSNISGYKKEGREMNVLGFDLMNSLRSE